MVVLISYHQHHLNTRTQHASTLLTEATLLVFNRSIKKKEDENSTSA